MSATELARRVAAYGLPGHDEPIPTPGGRPLDGEAWSELVGTAERQRVVGFLHAAVDGGGLPVTAAQNDEVAERHLAWCTSMLHLERVLLRAVDALEHAGLDVVVLKGTAAAHLNYPSPEVRSFGDNDLLLRPTQFDRALEVLHGLGYERQYAEARPGFDARFGKGAPLTGTEGDELDTHTNLLFGTFGFLIDVDELFASATSFRLGARDVPALGAEARLLHACYHAALGDPDPRLSGVRDLAQLLAADEHDINRLAELVEAWRCHVVLARGVALCERYLELAVPAELLALAGNHAPSRRELRAIDAYVGENRRFAAKVSASLPFIPGLRAKAQFLSAVLLPSADFVRSHRGEPGAAWLRRGARSLRRGR